MYQSQNTIANQSCPVISSPRWSLIAGHRHPTFRVIAILSDSSLPGQTCALFKWSLMYVSVFSPPNLSLTFHSLTPSLSLLSPLSLPPLPLKACSRAYLVSFSLVSFISITWCPWWSLSMVLMWRKVAEFLFSFLRPGPYLYVCPPHVAPVKIKLHRESLVKSQAKSTVCVHDNNVFLSKHVQYHHRIKLVEGRCIHHLCVSL